MSRYVRINDANYTLSVNSGGTITFDTDSGLVIINGDLQINGNQTILNSVDLTIEDNLIILNKGELGTGVTSGYSGIEIARGSLPNAQMIFDERVSFYTLNDTGSSYIEKPGVFRFQTVLGGTDIYTPVGIQTNSITTPFGYDLNLLGSTSGPVVVTVKGYPGTGYSRRILEYRDWDTDRSGAITIGPDENALVSVGAMVDYMESQFAFNAGSKISRNNTSIGVHDGLNSNIVGVVTDGTSAIYETDAVNGYIVNDIITITGCTPSSLDVVRGTIVDVIDSHRFRIDSTVTDPYVSGGTVEVNGWIDIIIDDKEIAKLTSEVLYIDYITNLSSSNDLKLSVVGSTVTVQGDLTTIGTLRNSANSFTLGDVTVPTDVIANDGGMVLKGTTDKTFKWLSSNNAWNSSEHVVLVSGKHLVLSGSTGVVEIAAPTNASGVLTLPNGPDVLVARSSTDTLTNKTINSIDNTVIFGGNTVSSVTGSGALVFSNTPTLATPVLGVATATSINKVAITAPSTSATLTIADGKTLTVSNSLTFTGIDSSSVEFGAGGTVLYSGVDIAVSGSTIGDSGIEGSGIIVNGTNYDSVLKVSDIGSTKLAETILHRHSTTYAPYLVTARSNSDTNAHAAVTSGMNLFSLVSTGYTGINDYQMFGWLQFNASNSGTINGTSAPGQIVLAVTPNGSVTPATALTIDQDKSAVFAGNISANNLSISSGKKLTVSNTLTFTGNDSSSVAFGSGGTVLYNGGALGTPSSGTLSNCSGLPIAGISGLGTGIGTWLATPSSANLALAITDETGTGSLVFGTSPTINTSLIAGGTSFDLINTNATTVNFAGAGTAISIGSSTGNTTINNNLVVSGNISTGSGTTTINNTTHVVGDLVIDGNFSVGGTTTTIDTANVKLSDNMIYLNEAIGTTITNAVGDGTYVTYTADNSYAIGMVVNITGMNPASFNATWATITSSNSTTFQIASTVTDTFISGGSAVAKAAINPDLGFAGGYNDGTYRHGGLFRDASDGVWKFFKNYVPEPDATVYIDTNDASFALADLSIAGLSLSGHLTAEGVTSTGATGTGKLVFDGSPTLVTPNIGAAIATSVNKLTITAPTTNATLTVADGKTLTVSNTLTFTGNDSSSVAFGSGGTVLYNGGALGTPSSGTLSNCSGLPIAGISGLGTGVGTWLATPSSANLALAITDETGTGSLVFGTSPTLTTPVVATSLSTSSTTFALVNTNVTTVNFAGVATAVNIANAASGASTLTFGPAITGNALKIAGTTVGTVNLTTDVTTGTVNVFPSVTGTLVLGGSSINSGAGVVKLGVSPAIGASDNEVPTTSWVNTTITNALIGTVLTTGTELTTLTASQVIDGGFDWSSANGADYQVRLVQVGSTGTRTQFGRLMISTDVPVYTASGASSSSTTVTVTSTVGLYVGMKLSVVSGTGTLAANTVVTSVSAGSFEVNNVPTVALSSATIKGVISGLYVSAAGATNVGTTITVDSTSKMYPGMLLSVTAGTGAFDIGTFVSSIVDATTFISSAAPVVDLSAGAVVTGSPNVYMTEYGSLESNGVVGVFDTALSTTNVQLVLSPNDNTNYVLFDIGTVNKTIVTITRQLMNI